MNSSESNWYAIRAQQDFKADDILATECKEVFFPKEVLVTSTGHHRIKALIPHMLFLTTADRPANSVINSTHSPYQNLNPLINFYAHMVN